MFVYVCACVRVNQEYLFLRRLSTREKNDFTIRIHPGLDFFSSGI